MNKLVSRCLAKSMSSVHSASKQIVHNVPMTAITRPLPSVLDEDKVQSMVKAIEENRKDELPPIDVMWIKGSENPDNNYYFAFGGCHRWEAHKRTNQATIKAKLVESSRKELTTYLGCSTPALL
eukprot:TRINITY_DN98398_c0_g1_i1.p1 TRINITY_DN98398_c0_g1~~TRINITY_DN98398_c0_g1_i1.p1  ORF type:complete len:124 (+),score=5.36 TRINITY_DN98398_c0_g1_i1:20-391(+)